jgi:stage V sporulation protein D (sporulation-specific penicillin-binding protein)
MILSHKSLSEKAKQQHVRVEDIQVRRGIIFDREGRQLALNLELDSLYCEPDSMHLDKKSLKKLASVMAKEPKAILTRIPDKGKFAWIGKET